MLNANVAAPNILLVTCHDAGRYFGCYGKPEIPSPNIDALAADGVLLENLFASSPVCSPSRGSIATGLYPQRNGLVGLTHEPWSWRFKPGVLHAAERFARLGYRAILVGNQHEDPDVGRLGFHEAHARQAGSVPTASEVADAAVSRLGGLKEQKEPFYMQVGFIETHRDYAAWGAVARDGGGVFIPPYIVPNEAARDDFALLQGCIEKLDTAFGRIMVSLRENGLEDNTIVVFCVDHGIEVPRAKWSCYDAGLETACLMRWPKGGVRGGLRVKELLSNVDLLPTLLDLAGLPGEEGLDGRSFAGLLQGEKGGYAPREAIFAIFEGFNTVTHPSVSRAVRTGRYKLIRNFSPCRLPDVPVDLAQPKARRKCPVAQLYDILEDPWELEDLSRRVGFEQVKGELDRLLLDWLQRMDDPILRGPTPTPYYREAMAEFGMAVDKEAATPGALG